MMDSLIYGLMLGKFLYFSRPPQWMLPTFALPSGLPE
jgi:hypothetical protein